MDITRLSCNGHSLENIRDYPLSLITTLCALLDDIKDIEDVNTLEIMSFATQGTSESIVKKQEKLLKDKPHG